MPLNSRMTVVFTEPIGVASLTPQNFQLRSGGLTVAGRLAFANVEHTSVEFTPDTDLVGGTTYELVVGQGIRDRDGSPLEAPATVPFTTLPAPVTATTQLAFVRDSQIYLINSDGSGLVRLTSTGPGVSNRDPAWSPDGTRIAFSSSRGGRLDPGGLIAEDIYTMNADGSNVVQRTSTALWNDAPAWSPDGRSIAFTTWRNGGELYVMDAANVPGAEVRLARGGQPTWSPDGRTIALSSSLEGSGDHDESDLYTMNADGSGIRRLIDGSGIADRTYERHFVYPAWAPDGRSIAISVCTIVLWSSGDFCNGATELALVEPDGSRLTVIARSGGFGRSTWSPDGRTIAFAKFCSPWCEPSIWYVRTDGSAEGLIVSNGHSPAWRP